MLARNCNALLRALASNSSMRTAADPVCDCESGNGIESKERPERWLTICRPEHSILVPEPAFKRRITTKRTQSSRKETTWYAAAIAILHAISYYEP